MHVMLLVVRAFVRTYLPSYLSTVRYEQQTEKQ